MISDIWTIGCFMLELLSASEVWQGQSEGDMLRDLKKFYVPKIHQDIPKHSWGIICECLNPFKETRIEATELLQKYVRLMQKMKIPDIAKDIEKYITNSDLDISKLNATVLDGEDPMAIRKCPLHPKYEASTFCAQCNEIICDYCKKTIHIDHSEKGVFFEYLEFVNLARSRIHSYKEKFNKYIRDANVPVKETYDVLLKTNEQQIEELYINQKFKIEEQFKYIYSILETLKQIEIDNLSKNKDFFKTQFNKILDNYNLMQEEITSVQTTLEDKEHTFLKFQELEQFKKEDCLKSITKDENSLNYKKKSIIKYISSFQKEKSQIERLKRYFEMFIEKYKENKINDLVKVIEKKNETFKKKYDETDLNEYLKLLIYEFEQIALMSSRNYFNSTSRELFISIVNTNKVFSYNLDAGKYFITEVDFTNMPINRFPNYSRSLIINGNLLVNGGYDEETKLTLPYFFFYDRMSKTLTRLNDMLFGHSAHSIIYIPVHYVVVVSGSGILKCEKYDMESNSWSELPDLNTPRQNCTLYYYNKQYLYAFGGAYWDDTKKAFIYVELVERLDLGFGSVEGGKKWEQLNTCKVGKEINLRKSVMSVLSYSPNKILLVGGSINYNTYSDENILFDFDKNEFSVKEGLLLPRKTCFPNKTFMYSGEKAYQLDNDGNVYEYDFTAEKFIVIKENTVLKATKTNV
jgi:hypothetical protein